MFLTMVLSQEFKLSSIGNEINPIIRDIFHKRLNLFHFKKGLSFDNPLH